MPSASARIDLMMSPWLTATQTAPGAVLGLDARRRGVVRRRPRGPASPTIDSPPGKVAADGWACTVAHSFSLARSLSGRPCHSP